MPVRIDRIKKVMVPSLQLLLSATIFIASFAVSLLCVYSLGPGELSKETDVFRTGSLSPLDAATGSNIKRKTFRLGASGVESDQVAEEFWMNFQNAVRTDDRKWIASHLDYPFYVSFPTDLVSRPARIIRSRREFLKNYNRIFDPSLEKAVARTSPKDLWANWAGIATPRGEIWIRVVCSGTNAECSDRSDLKVGTIRANSVFLQE